jgi:hypothetical protein
MLASIRPRGYSSGFDMENWLVDNFNNLMEVKILEICQIDRKTTNGTFQNFG